MSGWTRGSELDRSIRCPASTVLPRVADELRQTARSHEAASWGTMVHRWVATEEIIPSPDFPKHAFLFRKKLVACGLESHASWRSFREKWWPGTGIHEVSVALDCRGSGVAWSENGGGSAWKESFPDNWITGTLDYSGEILGIPWLDDLKTGAWPPTPPEKSAQVRFYALCRLKLWSPFRPMPEKVYLSITHWPRYRLDTPPQRYMHEVDVPHLLQVEKAIRSRYALRRAGMTAQECLEAGIIKVGDWCKFCPSAAACPLTN